MNRYVFITLERAISIYNTPYMEVAMFGKISSLDRRNQCRLFVVGRTRTLVTTLSVHQNFGLRSTMTITLLLFFL